MLPTLADSVAQTERSRRGIKGRKCFISKAGPTVLMANWCIR